MAADQALRILVKTEADTSGIDQTKGKLDELKGSAADAGEAAAGLGSLIGSAIGTTAVLAITAAVRAWEQFEAEEQRVFDEMERGRNIVLGLQQALLATADAMREMALIKALPIAEGIQRATADIIRLKTEQSLVNLQTKEGIDEYKKYTSEIASTTSLRDQLVKTQEREAAAAARSNRVGEQREYSALLKDTQTILQGIHQQQVLIQQAPFMGADEKSGALLRSYTAEMQKLQGIIAEIQAQKAGGGLDPAQLAQVDQKLQQAGFQMDLLRQKTLALQAPLRTELTAWANSFGTTMHQLAGTIEQTVGVALQGLNQWLVTGKFNAQAMLQQIEMLGLQLIEQLILQRVMSAINSAAATGQAAVTGPLIAAAFAPAATAVTVATEGQAALTAPASFAVALAAIQAMVIAHSGGRIGSLRKRHSGGLGSDEEMIIAQQGEFMVQRSVAERPGVMEFLSALNAGTFHGGGLIRRMHRGGGEGFGGGGFSSFEDYYNAVLDFRGGTFEPNLPEGWRGGWDPPADLDQNVGPQVIVPRMERLAKTFEAIQERSYDYGSGLGRFMNYSFNPPSWTPGFAQGPTMIPSQFDFQGYPIAQAAGAWTPTVTKHLPFDFPDIHEKHRGGMIGGVRVPRYHSGGMTGGGRINPGNVNVHNYTDLKALVKEMSTRKGRNIIVDTVRGHRIDLGMR